MPADPVPMQVTQSAANPSTGHLGILGGGQLGRMLALAAHRLAIPVRLLDTDPESPAGQIAPARMVGSWADAAAGAWLAEGAAAVTWEREDLPPAVLARLSALAPLRPHAGVIAGVADRLTQKQLFDRLGLATAAWAALEAGADAAQIDATLTRTGLPAMVKARRGGFDGRGQRLVRSREELIAALEQFRAVGCIVEALVPFDDECATLVARGLDGAVAHWPLVLTCQHAGQLAWALAPHPRESLLTTQARSMAAAIAGALEHCGVLAVEFFRCGDRLLANEIAPRVHNSGHWSIEGATCCQFENHVRAVLGLPLGVTTVQGSSLLLNCIGSMPERRHALAIPGLHLHDYGKKPRTARKVGHLTLVGEQQELARCLPDLSGLGYAQSVAQIAAHLG